MVFQAAALLPWRTVLGNIAFGYEMISGSRKKARERAEPLMELVGLAGYRDRYPHELSGGMRQRVNVARALAAQPQMLLMDEPLGALDAQTRATMQSEILRIWEVERKTVLFVTHDIAEAVFLSDRVLVLSAGPGSHIQEIVDIHLPRPRLKETRRDQDFIEAVNYIEDLIGT